MIQRNTGMQQLYDMLEKQRWVDQVLDRNRWVDEVWEQHRWIDRILEQHDWVDKALEADLNRTRVFDQAIQSSMWIDEALKHQRLREQILGPEQEIYRYIEQLEGLSLFRDLERYTEPELPEPFDFGLHEEARGTLDESAADAAEEKPAYGRDGIKRRIGF
jgi:hypothetical protein